MPEILIDDEVKTALLRLLRYCEENDWAGYEPYDALNSKVFQTLPFLDWKLPRLVLTQALKRSPVNVRVLMCIPKTQNPKALGLFLSAFVKLKNSGLLAEGKDYITSMAERLIALRSRDFPYWCWGYNFPWQTRGVLVPRWVPNLVCTSFAASGLLDAYELTENEQYLEMAKSAAEFILKDLYWADDKLSRYGFGYPLASVHSQVHNANFLGAALFCRVHKYTGDEKFVAPALKVARYSAAQQHDDGGWYYGEQDTQRWIDNFHTGFNLSALASIDESRGTGEFEDRIRSGLHFYKANFFREDGAVRYFHNQTYPIDAHCFAQSIITLIDLKQMDSGNIPLAHSAFKWAMENMWDERGFFYYRILRTCKIRTSYMRWTQAWMFLALSMLVSESKQSHNLSTRTTSVVASL